MLSREKSPPRICEGERSDHAAEALSAQERHRLVLSAGDRPGNTSIAARLAISERSAERILGAAVCNFERAMGRRPRA